MQTGVLVIVTLLVWCSSGSPLCPSLLQAPARGLGPCAAGWGLAWPPAPLASAAGGGSGLSTLCLQKIQEAVYTGRAWQERLSFSVPSPWVMGTAITAGAILPLEQGRAAVSLMLL